MASTSSKWGKFWFWSSIWPWRSQSIIPQNNLALNQGILHLWSKFGDPSLNGGRVIAGTNSWLTDTRAHTQAATIPEGLELKLISSKLSWASWLWYMSLRSHANQGRHSLGGGWNFTHPAVRGNHQSFVPNPGSHVVIFNKALVQNIDEIKQHHEMLTLEKWLNVNTFPFTTKIHN